MIAIGPSASLPAAPRVPGSQDLKATAQRDLADRHWRDWRAAGEQVAEAEAAVSKATTAAGEAGATKRLDAAKKAQELAVAAAGELDNAALETWNRACRAILRELMLTQLWRVPGDGQHLTRLRKEAARCLLNLAIAYGTVEPDSVASDPMNWFDRWRRKRRFARIRALKRAAVRLADIDARAHAEFARIALRWNEFEAAQAELQHALRIEQENPSYWAMLAEASAKHAEMIARTAKESSKKARDAARMAKDDARDACSRAEREVDFALLNVAAEEKPEVYSEEVNPEALYGQLGAAYAALGDDPSIAILESRRQLRRQIAEVLQSKPKQSRDEGRRSIQHMRWACEAAL